MALKLQDTPIRRKLMIMILVTSSIVLLLTCSGFIIYDLVTIRSELIENYKSRAAIVAANCSGALAFQNPADAEDVLGALAKDPQTQAACIYDNADEIFAVYPPNVVPQSTFPKSPGKEGHRYEGGSLIVVSAVTQGDRTLGKVYLRGSLSSLTDRYRAYVILVLSIIAITLLAAYLVSRSLQKQVSAPILALAETARAVSDRKDFSVRAPKYGEDETGLLTDAFNQMLEQIQSQNQTVRESEARVRAVLDSAISAVVVIDSAGLIIDWNERAEKMFGWSRSEALGRELAETILPPQYRSAHRRGMENFLKTGNGPVLNRVIEMSAIRKDGTEFPVELSISSIKTGNTVTFCGFITDITERRRLEEARVRMAAIVESSEDAIISKTLDGTITTWNPGAEKLYGYTEQQALGQPMLMLFPPELHVEDAKIRATVESGQSIDHFDTVRIRKDGKRVDVSVAISPLRDSTNKVIGASTIARDITEQKQSAQHETAFAKVAQQLSAVTSASAAARVIAETADQLLSWDACSLDLYEQDENLIHPVINIDTIDGNRVDVDPAYTGKEPSPLIKHVLDKGGQLILRKEPFDFEHEAVPFGNTGRPSASLMFVPMRRGERVIGILSIQSYTPGAYTQKSLNTLQALADQCAGALERVRAEESLRKINLTLERRVQERTAQLEAANKELEAFSYSVSHDLRAPLRHIAGFSELLKQEGITTGSPSERYLNAISGAAKRMGSLIDDLLVFSRMGRAGMRVSRVAMSELVDEVIREMSEDLGGRKINWKIDPLPEVHVDRAMFKQVWFNLISNAVKYTRQRETAEIEIKSRINEIGYTEFSIRDNGAGFDMEYADKLFGVFQRLHHAEEFEGTGIGLANVRRIVLRHGGQTWAEGKVDAGATFYFSVPPYRDEKHESTKANPAG